MATNSGTPIRDLSDQDLRKRLLALGYDVPVSVNREFLLRKLENASAESAGGGGGKNKKRHSMAVTPSATPPASPAARKRKSMASPREERNQISTPSPVSPLNSSVGTPQYGNSPGLSSLVTPTTPSPFVSRLGSPGSPNGESNHSPRYMSYYNMFKASSMGGERSGGDAGYGYYNRSIRMSAPGAGFSPVTSVQPQKSDRNGYAGASGGLGPESDWCGGTMVSKILVGLFVLFFLVIGGLYVRQSMSGETKGLPGQVYRENKVEKKPLPPPPTTMTYPICGWNNADPEACIPKDVVKNSKLLFTTLKDEMTQRARKKGCYSEVQDVVNLQEAKAFLYKLADLKKSDVDSAFHGMLLLIIENPRAGLTLESKALTKDIVGRDAAELDLKLTTVFATDVNPDFICGVMAFLTSVTMSVTIGALAAGTGYVGWKAYLFYKKQKKSEENQIFEIVEKVIDLLGKQYELSETSQVPAYVAVNHIRDELIPPNQRQKKEALWNKVVDYISNHESRVRQEIQHISGEEFKVWRWLPSASPRQSFSRQSLNTPPAKMGRFSMPAMSSSPIMPMSPGQAIPGPGVSPIQPGLYPNLGGLRNDFDEELMGGPASDSNSNTKWQGQAFETCEGSPNALPVIPTTCLKIRHMFNERETTANATARIEKEILGKCRTSKILHIGIDPTSVEGCVYVRCLTKDDARTVFKALHGWWFDGHLLSVKFLKEDRYYVRFAEAKNCTVPLGLPRGVV